MAQPLTPQQQEYIRERAIDRARYQVYEKEGSKVGILMLIQQGIFQVGTIFVLVVILVIVGILNGGFGADRFADSVAEAVADPLYVYLSSDIMQLLAGICFIVFFVKNKDVIKNVQFNKAKHKFLVTFQCFMVIVAVNLAVSGFGMLAQLMSRNPWARQGYLDNHGVLIFFLMAVFPGIVEELIFRGVLFRYLRRYGFFFAAFVSSLIFGLVHMNFTQLIFAGIMGFLLCIVYEKTGHLWCSMLLHFLNNAYAVLMDQIPRDLFFYYAFLMLALNAVLGLIFLFAFKLESMMVGDKKPVTRALTATSMIIFVVICLGICFVTFLTRIIF
ncbi:MAG: CPBP family intramembrane metalloprotease [Saccharofermentans sp.]|nr:CPBP family intramembrane metalloprotease [Saccharofermentans sp.]